MDFSKLSASQLAVAVLVDSGQTKEEAALAVLNDPDITGRLASQIEAKRDALTQEVTDAERAAFDASPEGRRRAALRLAAEADERAKLVASARTLLESEGYGNVSDLTDERVLHAAGIERRGELMSRAERDTAHVSLAERVAAGHIRDDTTLIAEAEAVGADPRSIAAYARSLTGEEAE
jgi:hypothetical protein